MFDRKFLTFRIKTGTTYVVVPDVELVYWIDYDEYSFNSLYDIESFQLSELIVPAWANCFKEKIKEFIFNNTLLISNKRTKSVVDVD
jgi:hypothetical protein